MLTNEQAVQKLERQIEFISGLKRQPRDSHHFKSWHRDTRVAILHIFGGESDCVREFDQIVYCLPASDETTPDYEFDQAYRRGLNEATALLRSMVHEIREYREPAGGAAPQVVLRLERLCRRFHLVARQLRERYNNRPPLPMDDEHDTRDLFHALLHLDFDDIRREESTPSHAGGGARVDFLLKREGIIIELKKTRHGLGAREVGDQLLLDIKRYQQHPDCRLLLCFVYDPDERVANPSGLEDDLSKSHDGLPVRVLVCPSRSLPSSVRSV